MSYSSCPSHKAIAGSRFPPGSFHSHLGGGEGIVLLGKEIVVVKLMKVVICENDCGVCGEV